MNNTHYLSPISETDPEIWTALQGEFERQRDQIELIASENLVSLAVLQAHGSVMTNKTVEGYPGHRYYGGAEYADTIEQLAIDRACSLFNCKFANVQAHSGSNANQAVFLATLRPGDTILSMDTAAGGHISHGHPATQTGRHYKIVSYGLGRENELIDYNEVEKLAERNKPALLIAGGSAYSRTIDFQRMGEIAKSVGAVFLVDMAHFAGLVATGHHPSPFPHADIVTSTTYKSLRGARGGFILWNDENISNKINNSLFPGVQGSVLLHGVAGKAVCLKEAAQPEFKLYNDAIIANARELSRALSDANIRVVSGGTDTGLMLVDISLTQYTGDTAVNLLESAGLTCNKNLIPFDTLSAEVASGLRLSVNAGTARGFNLEDFNKVGQWIAELLHSDPANHSSVENIRAKILAKVRLLCADHPIYGENIPQMGKSL